MATVTAADVKKLRDRTGAGMMAAKTALTGADGDFDKAIEALRVSGEAKSAQRGAERSAAAGLVAESGGALVELNSETDFVAKNEQFQQLARDIVAVAARSKAADREALLATELTDGTTVAEAVQALAMVIGEKIELGRVAVFDGQVASYLHRRASDLPPAVGVVVAYEGDDEATARATAMQVAAMRPRYVTRDEVPADVLAKERAIAEQTAREAGKPDQAVPRIVEGRVSGFLKEVVLVEQPSVREHKSTMQTVLDRAGITVTRFARFEVGQE